MMPPAGKGTWPTMFSADLAIPMVAPSDLGKAAARLLQSDAPDTGIRYVEGPACYSPNDVVRAFAQALGHPVTLAVTPRDQWESAYRSLGFSQAAAVAYARMTAVSVDGDVSLPADPEGGTTALRSYIAVLVEQQCG